jgi:hypothetical protein
MNTEPLSTFLRSAIALLDSVTGQTRIQRFLYLRYDLLNLHYPHEPFGVDQGTPDVFAEMLSYVTGAQPIPERKPGSDAQTDQTYWRRYRDWLRQYVVR